MEREGEKIEEHHMRKRRVTVVSCQFKFQGEGKRTPVRNCLQVTDQPQCFNKTCINMLSVGVCESTLFTR